MNSLLELNTWVNDVKSLVITDDNLDIFNKFMRFSPEKFADKMGMDRGTIVKEFDKHKKEIHNKVILFKKIKELKKRKVESSSFYYQGKQITSKVCYCTKFFKVKSVKFYPTIKYLYFYSDNEMIILPDEHRTVIISELEFNQYFIDKREETINKLLTND